MVFTRRGDHAAAAGPRVHSQRQPARRTVARPGPAQRMAMPQPLSAPPRCRSGRRPGTRWSPDQSDAQAQSDARARRRRSRSYASRQRRDDVHTSSPKTAEKPTAALPMLLPPQHDGDAADHAAPPATSLPEGRQPAKRRQWLVGASGDSRIGDTKCRSKRAAMVTQGVVYSISLRRGGREFVTNSRLAARFPKSGTLHPGIWQPSRCGKPHAAPPTEPLRLNRSD